MLDEATLLMRSLAEFSGDGSYLRRWEALQRDGECRKYRSRTGKEVVSGTVSQARVVLSTVVSVVHRARLLVRIRGRHCHGGCQSCFAP